MLSFSLPGDLPDPGIELTFPATPALHVHSLLLSHRKAHQKSSFIALPDKGGHSRLMPLVTVCPTEEDLTGSFIAVVPG